MVAARRFQEGVQLSIIAELFVNKRQQRLDAVSAVGNDFVQWFFGKIVTHQRAIQFLPGNIDSDMSWKTLQKNKIISLRTFLVHADSKSWIPFSLNRFAKLMETQGLIYATDSKSKGGHSLSDFRMMIANRHGS